MLPAGSGGRAVDGDFDMGYSQSRNLRRSVSVSTPAGVRVHVRRRAVKAL